jgi:hypothetical protein
MFRPFARMPLQLRRQQQQQQQQQRNDAACSPRPVILERAVGDDSQVSMRVRIGVSVGAI